MKEKKGGKEEKKESQQREVIAREQPTKVVKVEQP